MGWLEVPKEVHIEYRQYPLALLRTIWIILNNCYAVFPYLTWMLLLRPVLWIKPKLYWIIEGRFFNWLMAVVANWIWSCGHTLREVGDDITPLHDDESLVICNHISSADTALMMYALQQHSTVTNNMLWIMYIWFKWVNFGWVSQVHGDFFISMGKQTLIDLEKHLKTVYMERDRKWIVLFPEGTFLRNGKESSQRYARKMGYPVLENASLPRMGAMETILDTLNVHVTNKECEKKRIKYVIDVTIGYPDNVPLDIYNVFFHTLTPRTITILYRVFPISQVPLDHDGLQNWTFKLWQEKDAMLEEFYKTGRFPELSEAQQSAGVARIVKEGRHLTYSGVWMVLLQCIFLLSCYIQYCMFTYALSFV